MFSPLLASKPIKTSALGFVARREVNPKNCQDYSPIHLFIALHSFASERPALVEFAARRRKVNEHAPGLQANQAKRLSFVAHRIGESRACQDLSFSSERFILDSKVPNASKRKTEL